MKADKVLIACGIFKDEINFLLERKRGLAGFKVIWLDAGLHSDLKLLESELLSAIDIAKILERWMSRYCTVMGAFHKLSP